MQWPEAILYRTLACLVLTGTAAVGAVADGTAPTAAPGATPTTTGGLSTGGSNVYT